MQSEDVTTQAGSGELLADISRTLVQLYKDFYGKGPTKARTYVSGDLLVCLLQGGFLPGERTLRDAGRGDAVSDQRDALQEVLRERFTGAIEEITGRKVITFISGTDLQTETSAELFLLEPLDVGDESDAIAAWAAQTRRQARALREEQVALREKAASLRHGAARPPAPGTET